MERTTPQVFAVLLCLVLTRCSRASSLRGEAQQLPTDNNHFPPSELTLSVLVNQMMLIKMLNDSSSSCSLYEAAIAESNARQEDAREELRRSLEVALTAMQEKKEEALHELAQKENQLAALTESAINELTETKQRILQELNKARQATMTRKTFELHTDFSNHIEAAEACKQSGGRLAVPENEMEHAQLLSMIKRENTGEKPFWIGVDDKEKEGVWVNSNTGLPLTFINFNDGQPNGGSEDCVAFVTGGYTGWHDYPCNYRGSGYFCEVVTVAV